MYPLSPLVPQSTPVTGLHEMPHDVASSASSSSSPADRLDTPPSQLPAPAGASRSQRDIQRAYQGITPTKDVDSLISTFSTMCDELKHTRVCRSYQAAVASGLKDSFLQRVHATSALNHGPERTKELARLSWALGLPEVRAPDRIEALVKAVNERDSDHRTALHEVSERQLQCIEGDGRQTAERARAAEIMLLLKTGAGNDKSLADVAMCRSATPGILDEILRNQNAGPYAFLAVLKSPVLKPGHLTDIVQREHIPEGVLVAAAGSRHATNENLRTVLHHGAAGNGAWAAVARATNVTTQDLEEIVRHNYVGDEALFAVIESPKVTNELLKEIIRLPGSGGWVRLAAINAMHR